MPWCEKCDVEYRDGFTVCADCSSGLAENDPEPEKAISSDGRLNVSFERRIIAVFLLCLVTWTGPEFFIWRKCKIPLPDGSGSVVYMTRWLKYPASIWERKVRIETTQFRGKHGWLELTRATYPVNVYWYPARKGKGPYLKFGDGSDESLVDLRNGTSLLVAHYIAGDDNPYVGEIKRGSSGYSISSSSNSNEVLLNGRPARKLDNYVASGKGTYIGRIQQSYSRFVSSKEAKEGRNMPDH